LHNALLAAVKAAKTSGIRIELVRTPRPESARPAPLTDRQIVARLESPIGPGPAIRGVLAPPAKGERVCIVVPDQTRRAAVDRILPAIFHAWAPYSPSAESLTILIATGIHRCPTAEEMETILGRDMFRRLGGCVRFHDPDDSSALVHIGNTPLGHRVLINRTAAEADRLVLIGAASFHYHAGFGGGRKLLVPGVAGTDTIAHTHSLALDPMRSEIRAGVEIGRLDGNPVAEELMNAASLRPPDLTCNTVLDTEGRLIGLFCGEMDAAHRAACALVRRSAGLPVQTRPDLVVASALPARNWIQSHKALYNAHRAVSESGMVVLHAPCEEGLGNERFRHWIRFRNADELAAELRKHRETNGQTALSTLLRAPRTVLVTRMTGRDTEDLGIATAAGLDDAVIEACGKMNGGHGSPIRCMLMPEALHTVPFPAEG